MRTFSLGSGAERRQVVLQLRGSHVGVIERRADGSTKRSDRELPGEAEARATCEKMARALLTKGYVELPAPGPARPRTAPQTAAVSTRPAPRPAATDPGELDLSGGDDDDPVESDEPVLTRLTAPGRGDAGEVPKKKKKKKNGKRGAKPDDGLDKRVVAGAAAAGVLFVGFALYLAFDIFLKPASIIGAWKGSRLDYEIGKPITQDKYAFVFDDARKVSMSRGAGEPRVGTYTVQGKRLKLRFKAEPDLDFAPDEPEAPAGPAQPADGDGGGDPENNGPPGEADAGQPAAAPRLAAGSFDEDEYTIELGRATLDLYDPSSGKKVVQLIRGGSSAPAAPAAPKPPSVPGGPIDASGDAQLAAIEFVAKDGAFKLRHPAGWKPETGGRADNSYSWIKLAQGNAKIKVTADAMGSLMSGSDSDHGNHPEGSEFAPVHRAHVLAKKAIADEYSGYAESEPTLFKGARLGEGRIATYNASGGLFGSKITGYRITLLTGDRRVTVLAECPAGEFAKLKPSFLAVGRSLSR